MTDVMRGFRILEVAEHTFVPAASALLADWGAEVIKVEHVERGDAMRGIAKSSGLDLLGSGVHVLLEHSNRGKQSIGLDLTTDEGLEVLHRLIATSDVFLTNKLPKVRTKLKIDLDDVRAHNDAIVYVCGTGQGERGPEADNGSYDVLSFWHRTGMALGTKAPEAEHVPSPPAPAFGDSIGAMTIAGGIMGALLHRERTGEATTVDVSLLGVGLWSIGAALALSLQLDVPWGGMPAGGFTGNPLVATYRTSDDRFISLSCLQAGKYWNELVGLVGRADLAEDERFADADLIKVNGEAGHQMLTEAFAGEDVGTWRDRLAAFSGQWTVVQDTLEATADPQTVANGLVQQCETAEGATFSLAAAPVQFGGEAAVPRRAPAFNEHGDAILEQLGFDWDAIVDLKVRGVVA